MKEITNQQYQWAPYIFTQMDSAHEKQAGYLASQWNAYQCNHPSYDTFSVLQYVTESVKTGHACTFNISRNDDVLLLFE